MTKFRKQILSKYFNRLWLAICGKNPLSTEFNEQARRYRKAIESITILEERIENLADALVLAQDNERSYLCLVENLRERLAASEKRIEEYI